MSRIGIDHFNIAVPADQLATLVSFYTDVVGFHDGARPPFTFPGHWLYADGVERAVLHLASYEHDTNSLSQPTGRFNHICFNMIEPLDQVRSRLNSLGIEFRERNNPANPTVTQVFLSDPSGVGLELSFSRVA